MMEPINLIAFLAATVIDAQRAQRKYGIPASILISIGLSLTAWNSADLPEGNQWFQNEAAKLALSPEFRTALPFVNDARSYLAELERLDYFRENYRADDILGPIERYDLAECDVAGFLPFGEYSGTRHDAIQDETGRVELRRALDLRDVHPTLLSFEMEQPAEA